MYDYKYTQYLCNITLYLIVKETVENTDEEYSPTFVGDDGGGGRQCCYTKGIEWLELLKQLITLQNFPKTQRPKY